MLKIPTFAKRPNVELNAWAAKDRKNTCPSRMPNVRVWHEEKIKEMN